MKYNTKDLREGERHEQWLQEFNGEMRKITMRQPENMEGTFFVEMQKDAQPYTLGTVKEDIGDIYVGRINGKAWVENTPREAAEELVHYANLKDQERQRRFEKAQEAWKAKQEKGHK